MRRLAFLLLALLYTPVAHAQTTMTLAQTIERATTRSPAAQIARLNFGQARWGYRAFQADYLPSLSLSGELPNVQRTISDVVQDDGSVRYVESNRTSGRATASISQPIPMTGGRLSVSSGLSRLDTEFDQETFTQWQSTPLILGVQQPLFQFNEMKWTRRTEPLRYEIARRRLAQDLEGVALDAVNRFFEVYLAQINLDIATINVAVNDTIFVLSQGRFEIGAIAENDLLQSELALLNAQSEQSRARIAYQEALRDLKLSLDLPYDTDLTIVPPTSVPALPLDPSEAVAQAQRLHPDFLDLELEELEADREVARARRTNSFSADLTASFGLNQTADNFDNVYADPLDQQQVRVGFQVPLFRWGQGKANVEAAVASRERVDLDASLRRKELEQDVYFEARQLDQLQQQVTIDAKADTVAARRFEVAKNRYLIGKIDITELFNAQREKDAARRTYIQTLRQFWTTYFNLRRLTLYDFARREAIPPPVN